MARFLAAMFLVMLTGSARAQDAACPTPRQMDGFRTCADVAQAEQEGSLILYATSPETNTIQLLAAFHGAFPAISTGYIRLQAGSLYTKLMTERQARSYLVDLLQMSDMGLVLDLQKRGGWDRYVSPELDVFKPEYRSQPDGYWAWQQFSVSGLAYNVNLVSEAEAPKTWQDALDPKWADSITVKTSNAGAQHNGWYQLRRLYGDAYWETFALLKPRAFDSWVQQFGRVIDGQDRIVHTAGYSAYLELKAKGAPLGFSFPPDGSPVDPTAIGILGDAPHPQAARLFMDWMLGVPGQTALVAEAFSYSVRPDVGPPQGGVPLSQVKQLLPESWETFEASQRQFVRDWNRITGMR
jgi:iron(III) transport system substrate-binding protein